MTLTTMIAELEEALKAATPGPWDLDGIAIAHLQPPYGAPIDVCLMGEPAQYAGDTTPLLPNYEANARLIALMRNSLPTLIEALTAYQARAEAAEARVGELEGALLQHNERLRSAIAVADRNGAETNWKAFRGDLHYTAAEYHELVNSIRTLKGATDGR